MNRLSLHRSMREFGAVVAVGVLLAAVAPAGAHAQSISPLSSSGAPTKLVIDYEPSTKPGIRPSLAARLGTKEGDAVGGQTVEFFFAVKLLGERNAFLGRAQTDAGGVARLQFSPSEERYTVVVRFTGSKGYTKSEARADVKVTPVATSPVTVERSPLHSVKTAMPKIIGVGVAALWVLLIVLSISTVRFIRRPRPT